MKSQNKTKVQVVDDMAHVRQQIAELKAELAASQRTTAEKEQLLQTEREDRYIAETLLQTSLMLNGSLNYEGVLDCILEQVGQIVSHDAACVLLLEPEGKLRIFRWHGYTEFETCHTLSSLTFDANDMPWLSIIQEKKEAVIISKLEAQTIWTRKLGGTWLKSHLSLPIVVQGELMGLLAVDSATPNRFTPIDVGRLSLFIDQAALALKNARLYDRAREEIARRVRALKSERNFVSAVLDTAGALVMVVDVQGYILRFNRACEETTDYLFEEVKGAPFWDLFLMPDEVAHIKRIFETLQTTERTENYQNYWLTKDSRRRFISWTNTLLRDNEGKVEYIICTGIDITEPQQLEERLVAIHQLGRELNLLRDEEAIWEIALETAAFLLEFRSAGYGVVNEFADELEYLYQPIRGVPTTVRLHLPLDTASRIRVLRSHSERTVNTFETVQSMPLRPDKPAQHDWLSAPMKVRERLLGMLDIEGRGSYQFTANDQRLLQTLADQTAVAIENARLHHEARQRVDELTTMNMISQAITSTLNLEETLTIITDHSIRLLEATAASVVLNDVTHGDLWFHAASGGSSDFVRGKRLPSGQGIVGWVIEHSEAALVLDVTQDPRFYNKFDQQTGFITHSLICSPLRTGAKTIGAIEVLNKKNSSFSQEDLQLLTWLATPAATAIENARLFEGERTARRQAEILREATATLTSSLDSKHVLNSILIHLEGVVSFDNASVFLRNDDYLQVVAERGLPQQVQPAPLRLYPTDTSLYQEIQTTKRPVILTDAQTEPRFEVWQSTADIRGWMGVPLMVQWEVLGCLTLNSHDVGAYGQIEADLTQAFANQAAVAIQNARLFEQVRAGRKRLQSLSRRLVEVQEMERRHIARELHDEAGQSLSSLMVGLRLLEREVSNPDEVIKGIIELKQMTNEVSENLHRLAIDLRPASLDHLGLEAALRQHIETFGRQNNLSTQFEAVGLNDKRLLPAVETNLYRVVQEALTNVIRHAKATQVDVLLERRGDQVVAIIEDNGVGFDTDAAGQSSRLGLLGMRERAEMLSGNLMIESTIGTGTTIYVEVPYAHSNSDS